MKILIVEDNPLLVQAIERAGEELRVGVDCATDGWEAIEKLESEEYAVIVVDADLPRHSGFGVPTYLREEIGGELGNVIVMTSSDCDDVRRKLTEHVNVIAKSSEMTALSAAMQLALRR